MCEAHVLHVFHKLRRQLLIIQNTVLFFRNPPPGTQVNLIDRYRRIQGVVLAAR